MSIIWNSENQIFSAYEWADQKNWQTRLWSTQRSSQKIWWKPFNTNKGISKHKKIDEIFSAIY